MRVWSPFGDFRAFRLRLQDASEALVRLDVTLVSRASGSRPARAGTMAQALSADICLRPSETFTLFASINLLQETGRKSRNPNCEPDNSRLERQAPRVLHHGIGVVD